MTQEEYKRVMGTAPDHLQGDDCLPVHHISWYDAVEFCNAVSRKEGVKPFYEIVGEKPERTVSILGGSGYRLPTEAEWEYACRAGTTGERYGNLSDIAWYGGNSGNQTHPVGKKQPNAWGLYDMLGNVWEWCADWYDAGAYGRYKIGDLTPPAGGSARVVRGGSWGRGSSDRFRCADRSRTAPTRRDGGNGFRCARTDL